MAIFSSHIFLQLSALQWAFILASNSFTKTSKCNSDYPTLDRPMTAMRWCCRWTSWKWLRVITFMSWLGVVSAYTKRRQLPCKMLSCTEYCTHKKAVLFFAIVLYINWQTISEVICKSHVTICSLLPLFRENGSLLSLYILYIYHGQTFLKDLFLCLSLSSHCILTYFLFLLQLSDEDAISPAIEKLYWSSAVILVYDITNSQSYQYATDLLKDIKHEKPNHPCVLIGNKTDLEHNRSVSQSEASDFVSHYSNCCHVELSAASSDFNSVSDTFENLFSLSLLVQRKPIKRKKSFVEVAKAISNMLKSGRQQVDSKCSG